MKNRIENRIKYTLHIILCKSFFINNYVKIYRKFFFLFLYIFLVRSFDFGSPIHIQFFS